MWKSPVSECYRCDQEFFWHCEDDVLCQRCSAVVKRIIELKAKGCLVGWKEAPDA